MQDRNFPGMIAEPIDPTVDRTTTNDRRALLAQLLQVMGQFGITQAKLSESASISPGTMSNVCADNRVAWTTWESILVGLIKHHPSAALSFWVGLSPDVKKAVLASTSVRAISTFASEINSLNAYDSQTVKNSIKFMLGQLSPADAREFLIEIAPLHELVIGDNTTQEPAPSKNDYDFCAVTHTSTCNSTTINIFPQGIEMGNQDISALIQATFQHNGSKSAPVDPEQQKKSH